MKRSRMLIASAALAAAACGNDAPKGSDFSKDGGAAGDAAGPSVTGDPGFDIDASTPTTNGCSDASKLIYTVTRENVLHSFDPANLRFARIGQLACPAGTATPFSMAVDRSATAWILYNDGHLFKVSTKDASCTATTYVPNQHAFLKFGMGFSADFAGSASESLFVDDIGGGQGFGRLDLGTMTLTPLGDHTDGLSSYGADVTGTGDGRSYGFFTSTPATVAEFVKTSGATPTATQHRLAGVDTGTDWAFAFWGGDFWLFTAAQNENTNVTRFSPGTDTSTVVLRDAGFHVNGAGVSTCAPTVPPK